MSIFDVGRSEKSYQEDLGPNFRLGPQEFNEDELPPIEERKGIIELPLRGKTPLLLEGPKLEQYKCPHCGEIATKKSRNRIDVMLGTINWVCPNNHCFNTYLDGRLY